MSYSALRTRAARASASSWVSTSRAGAVVVVMVGLSVGRLDRLSRAVRVGAKRGPHPPSPSPNAGRGGADDRSFSFFWACPDSWGGRCGFGGVDRLLDGLVGGRGG